MRFLRLSAIAITMAMFSSMAAGEGQVQPVKLDLHVMSQCPFGVQAENTIIPIVKTMGSDVDFNLHFIATQNPAQADGSLPDPAFRSLHGPGEVQENIRHLCAMKYFPQQAMDFILARNQMSNAKDPKWQAAAEKVGIDPAKLEACSGGAEGAKLLSDNIQLSLERQVNSSPTIYIGGSQYKGPRSTRSITLAICGILKDEGMPLPDACAKAQAMPPDAPAGGNRPAPAVFEAVVLTDGSCSSCKATLEGAIKKNHAGAKIKKLDVGSEEGRAFMKEHDVRYVPYYYLEGGVEKDGNFQSMKGYYAKDGDGYAIRPAPDTYTPAMRLDRKRVPYHLDLFVEANSPFTAQAEAQLMKFLAESDVKDLTFSIHYIVQETVKGANTATTEAPSPSTDVRAAPVGKEIDTVTAGPLTSRRGEIELQESLRQVCLFQHASVGTFFTYLTCRNQNLLDKGRGDQCLQMTEPLEQCLKGPEGENLLRQDAGLVRDLDITSGPVLLWENVHGPFDWNEVDWKEMLTQQEN